MGKVHTSPVAKSKEHKWTKTKEIIGKTFRSPYSKDLFKTKEIPDVFEIYHAKNR